MAISRWSQALSVNFDKQAWYADSGATKHMTEHRDWFSTFKDIPSGTWSVAIADDRNLWVRGVGDINITRLIDGVHKKGVLKKVLFVPDLRRNLFLIGLVSKAGFSFPTLRNKYVLYDGLGQGPKVLEGNLVGTLYKLSIDLVPLAPTLDVQPADQLPSTVLAVTTSRDTGLVLWHNRMGHVNIHTIKNMSAHDSVKDLPIFSHNKLLQVCPDCALGK